MTIEHFKETEWLGFYVGSEGSIKNLTGIKFVQYRQNGVMYVGLEFNNKRTMRKLSDLLYKYHIHDGKPLPPGIVVDFKDKNSYNLKLSNLYLRLSHNYTEDHPYYSVNKTQNSNKGN